MWTPEQCQKHRDSGERYPSGLTNAQWETIAPLLCVYHPLTASLREMVNGCLYHGKTGCQWRFMPKEFGPSGTVRYWHGRFRRDGLWIDLSALLVRAVRQREGRPAEPATVILDSQSVVPGPQKGERGVDGHKKIKGIKRHVLTCPLGSVIGALAAPANVHDTAAAGRLSDRAAEDGWRPQRVKADGIYTGERMGTAAARHDLEVQAAIRPKEIRAFMPLPLRWKTEAAFGAQTSRYRHLTRNLTQSPAAAEDAIWLANSHRLLQRYHRAEGSIV